MPPSPTVEAFRFRDILAIRLLNAWYLATFFQPDEFFQVLEPAWQLAFGPRSGAWLTWEWQYQLRSSLHPLLFSGAYLLADRLSATMPPGSPVRTAAVIVAPRILQALIAALGDWYTFKLSRRIFSPDESVSLSALFLQLLSPWQWYCSTRTFSNSLETTLTVMALYHWPWQLLGPHSPTKENPKTHFSLQSLRICLCLSALAVVLRPTNILVWATIAVVTLTRVTLQGPSPLTVQIALSLVREAFLCGSLVLGVSALADRWYFGLWTFPPLNWLNFNISKNFAVFYGRNPWHYYILQGIPLLCTTALPFALITLFRPQCKSLAQANILKTLSYTIIITVTALSFVSHKEVRFIYPLLPSLHILSAPRVVSFFTSAPPEPPSSSSPFSTSLSPSTPRRPILRRGPFLFFALGTNMLLAGYLSFLHQPAPLSVLSFLRTEYERLDPSAVHLAHSTHYSLPSLGPDPAEEEEDDANALFALFLTPCHSTPWRSHLVYPSLTARALTCEPPLHTAPNTPERLNYRDEADRFYDDPITFLRTEMFPLHSALRPKYIVGFDGIEPWLRSFGETIEGKALGWTLKRVWGGFNGFVNEDWRRAGELVVWDTAL